MATYGDALKKAVKDAFCSVISDAGSAVALVKRKVTGDDVDDSSYPTFLSPYLCNQTPPPPIQPPHAGGQCCNKEYLIEVEYRAFAYNGATGCSDSSLGIFTLTVQRVGKIIELRTSSDGRIVELVREDCNGLRSVSEVTQRDQFCRQLRSYTVAIAPGFGEDDCGNISPKVPPLPPNWNKRETNITYITNNNEETNIPVTMAFGYATFNVNADVSIPVTIDVGGITIEAGIDLQTGDIDFFPITNEFGDRRPGTQPTDVLPPPGVGTPNPPPDLPPEIPPIDEGESEGESAIVAALVTVSSVNSDSIGTLFQTDNPNISIPNYGLISFHCRVGTIQSGWTADIPVKNRRHIIPCPLPWGAFDVKGTPRPGVDWVITPLYSKKNSPITYPVEVT